MVAEDLPTFYPMCEIFFRQARPVRNSFFVVCPASASRHLVSLVGGRLRRPFRGGAFLRASASPRGGAQIILPLHGILFFQGHSLQGAFEVWGIPGTGRLRIPVPRLFVGIALQVFMCLSDKRFAICV